MYQRFSFGGRIQPWGTPRIGLLPAFHPHSIPRYIIFLLTLTLIILGGDLVEPYDGKLVKSACNFTIIFNCFNKEANSTDNSTDLAFAAVGKRTRSDGITRGSKEKWSNKAECQIRQNSGGSLTTLCDTDYNTTYFITYF